MTGPIFYSFRRCPYAMRARLALHAAQRPVRLREIVLRDKPQHMIEMSPKATVPVLVLPNGAVIDESLEIMLWALEQADPEGWLDHDLNTQLAFIKSVETDFKPWLDRTKYNTRYEGDPLLARNSASAFIDQIETHLTDDFLFGPKPKLADMATLPFIRQFAHIDRNWFWAQNWPKTLAWLEQFLASERFTNVMQKFPLYHDKGELIWP